MISTVSPITREVVVPVTPERAFEFFTAHMTEWWPPEHHLGPSPIAEILIEPEQGGRWYTRHEDGSETMTGFVAAWEPPERLVVTWQIGADWRYHADLRTIVELRFTAEGADRTRVRLEHRELENFGEQAEKMRVTFESPGAWDATLQAFAKGLATAQTTQGEQG